MKAIAVSKIIFGLMGIGLITYAILVVMQKAPVAVLYRPKDEKAYRKELRWHSICYGGIGMLALLDAIYFFTHIEWVQRLYGSLNIIITLYLLITLCFRVYRRGWIPGDS